MLNLYPGDRVSIISAGVDGQVVGTGDGAAHGVPGERCVLVRHDGGDTVLPHYHGELRRLAPIGRAGAYELPDLVYQRDPCPEPSLNPTLAIELLSRSPLHAATIHPRIGQAREAERLDFDLGKAAHALVLEGEGALHVIDAADYRSNAAKAARELAYAEGRIPVLAPRLVELHEMAGAAVDQLGRHACGYIVGRDGARVRPVLAYPDVRGCWLRCRPDALLVRDGVAELYGYTTTAGSAHPARWGARTLWGLGPDGELGRDVAAAFEARVALAVLGVSRVVYRFVVQEQRPPFGLNVIELGAVELGEAGFQVERAVAARAACIVSGQWVGYSGIIYQAQRPAWVAPALATFVRMSALPDDPAREPPLDRASTDARLEAFLA